MEYLAEIWTFRWLLISIVATLSTVQGFKAVIKYYCKSMDVFTRKLLIFIAAVVSGYFITTFFMEGEIDNVKWAGAIAILNPVIYMGLLAYAKKKRMLWLIAILKMRKFETRQEGSSISEKLLDEENKTVAFKRYEDTLR